MVIQLKKIKAEKTSHFHCNGWFFSCLIIDIDQLILKHLPHYGNLTEQLKEETSEYHGIIRLAEEFASISI
jgi:hypothetical protein